jgi:hypothetical protein
MEGQRIDKWLWCARLARTGTLANALVTHGNDLAEILVEPILQYGRVIVSNVVEGGLGEALLPDRDGEPRRDRNGNAGGGSGHDREETPSHLPLWPDFGEVRHANRRTSKPHRRRLTGAGVLPRRSVKRSAVALIFEVLPQC